MAGFEVALKVERFRDAAEHLRAINKARAELPADIDPDAFGATVSDDLPSGLIGVLIDCNSLRHQLLEGLIRSDNPVEAIPALRLACDDAVAGYDPRFRFLLGLMLRRTGKWSEAHGEFLRLAEEGRQIKSLRQIHLDSEFMLATCLLESGRWDEAQAAFAKLVREHELPLLDKPAGADHVEPDSPFRAGLFLLVCSDLTWHKPHLSEIVSGARRPTTRQECRSFGLLCLYSGYYNSAADLLAQYLRQTDVGSRDGRREALATRYFAASAAARAGTPEDKGGTNSATTARWREQALIWASEDFAFLTEPPSDGAPPNSDRIDSAQYWACFYCHDYFLSPVRDSPNRVSSRWKLFWKDTARLTEHAPLNIYWEWTPLN